MKININFDIDISPDELQEYQDIFDILVSYEGVGKESELFNIIKESVNIKDFIKDSTQLVCKQAAYKNIHTLSQLKEFLVITKDVVKMLDDFMKGDENNE